MDCSSAPSDPRGEGRGELTPPSAEPEAEEPREPRLSRTARKREAEALQKLGVRLTALRPQQLQSLDLPDTLRDAVLEAQRLRSRAALARQRQYIGRLMRDLDPEPIERALDAKMPR